MKRIFFLLVLVSLVFLNGKKVFAGGFNLKSIGSVNTSGQQISHWWYTRSNPTFVGEALAGSGVTISIDGSETSVTADGSGSWSYTSGTLTSGDHSISMASNGSTINFTLTIGSENVNWDAVNSGASETLPAAGTVLPTILLSVGGLALVIGAKRVAKEN